jgi:hypothetical protein
VPEAPRIPIIRVTRPYASEKEFIDADFSWIGGTTVILPGGPARPSGELVRFEVILANGAPVLRGEGNVIGHNPPGSPRPPGLEIRFTRVDAKSKAVLDRVRERRRSLSSMKMTASLLPGSSLLPGVSILPDTASMAPAAGAAPPRSEAVPISLSSEGLPVLKPPTDTPSERSGVRLKRPGPVAPPANRDEILERLRERARSLAAAGGLAFKKKS